MKITKKPTFIILMIMTALAAGKMLLQSFSLDEEYQVLMSYRNITGDGMIDTMWEPHQTSSFLCTLFMWPYYQIAGTLTGVVIYLRFMGTLVHLCVSVYLYKIMKHFLPGEYAFYLGLIFFNTIPKLIMLPEFGGMQVWFGVLSFLLIIDSAEYITLKFWQKRYIASYIKIFLAAVSMCLEVLSYPSCALLVIPFLLMIWVTHKEADPVRKCLVFLGTCGVIGGAYVGYFLMKLGLDRFMRNVEGILQSDLTHTFDTGDKLARVGSDLLRYCIGFVGLTVTALLLVRLPFLKKYLPRHKGIAGIGILIILSNVYQLYLWVVCNTGYEYLQMQLAVTLCLGLWLLTFGMREKSSFVLYMWFGALIGIISLVCVMLLTDLTLATSIPHGFLGSICMLALFAYYAKETQRWICGILLFVCLSACVGKGYTLRGGVDYNNILQSENICRYGPAIGTISNYMGAHIYNSEYELWQREIPEGSKVLIATDNVHSTNTIQYTFKNAEVCHYSVVDPTAYDERLLTYWSFYPEKQPDIIVVDCWFGNSLFPADSWMMQYIEKEFGYSEMVEGEYVRIYKK